MNVSCPSCSAKYAVPDDKIRGKKVKITCKHCSTGIVVDGTRLEGTPATSNSMQPGAPLEPARASIAASAPKALRWDVVYPDERQETLSAEEIAERYAAGALDDRAFLWREGMSDWRAPFDVAEVESALSARGLRKRAEPVPAADEEATVIQRSPLDSFAIENKSGGVWHEPAKEAPSSPEPMFALSERAAPAKAEPAPAAANPPGTMPTARASIAGAKAAARRTEARGGADLFGDLSSVGSESDESLGAEKSDAEQAAAQKLTGARNESSVLFSLDALIKNEPAPKAKPKKDDSAALLHMGGDDVPNSLANVGGFGSAFAAPDFTAPVQAPLPEPVRASAVHEAPTAPTQKRGIGIYVALGAVLALGGAAFALGLPQKFMAKSAESVTPAAPEAKAEPPVAAPTAVSAPGVEPSGTAAAAPSPNASSAPASATATSAPTTPVAAAPAAAAPANDGAAKPAAAATPKPTNEPSKAEEPAKPVEPAAAKPTESPEPAADGAPFDKAAAVAALTAAATQAQTCKAADGPTGSGRVTITFMPSGRATNTQVSGDFAGTAVGGCVARVFRSAKVPPFAGEPTTVGKGFSIQ